MALQPLLLRHPAVPSARSPSPSVSIGTEAAPKNLLLGILLLPAGIALHACLQLCRVPRSVSWTHSAHCSLLPSQPCFEPQTPLCSTEPYTSAVPSSALSHVVTPSWGQARSWLQRGGWRLNRWFVPL